MGVAGLRRRGLEFGTSGLHQPFGVLIREGPILGRPNVHWLDAGETATLRYACFALPASEGTAGVQNIALSDGEMAVKPIRQPGADTPTPTLRVPLAAKLFG